MNKKILAIPIIALGLILGIFSPQKQHRSPYDQTSLICQMSHKPGKWSFFRPRKEEASSSSRKHIVSSIVLLLVLLSYPFSYASSPLQYAILISTISLTLIELVFFSLESHQRFRQSEYIGKEEIINFLLIVLALGLTLMGIRLAFSCRPRIVYHHIVLEAHADLNRGEGTYSIQETTKFSD